MSDVVLDFDLSEFFRTWSFYKHRMLHMSDVNIKHSYVNIKHSYVNIKHSHVNIPYSSPPPSQHYRKCLLGLRKHPM